MPPAAYKDLCVDAADRRRLGRFWAAALGLSYADRGGGIAVLTGPTPRHTLWINEVPEPKVVKNRLHIDVHAESVAGLEALGATVVDDSPPWTVMADPEGGEFCAFIRDDPPQQRLYELVLDATDPRGVARWWADLLGGRFIDEGEGRYSVGEISGAPFERLFVNPTDEPKSVKNRVHLDVVTDDVAALLARGAALLHAQGDATGWDVLADPAGNEFCAFVP